MKIHIFSTCWNEILLLPYYIRHYEPFVDRFVILDDNSTDGSLEYLRKHPKVEIRGCRNRGGSYIERSRDFWNTAWKESLGEADWVINSNIDEHLYHKDIIGYLKSCSNQGITILPSSGYEMISHDVPSVNGRLCDALMLGSPTESLSGASSRLSKIMIFDPDAIEDINYAVGRHLANPTGNVIFPEKSELKILHYKFLGLKYLEQRYAELKTGLTSEDNAKQHAYQYHWNRSGLRYNFRTVEANAVIATDHDRLKSSLAFIRFLPRKLLAKVYLLVYLFIKPAVKAIRKLNKKNGRES
jgi:glycosyltransferase involved in cell wall biosynthesis